MLTGLLTVCYLSGCASSYNNLTPMAGITSIDNGASQATYTFPITRLDYDIWRAARRCGWAMPYPIAPNDDGHYRGKGMVPDGRDLIVDAWPNTDNPNRFTVKVKVGHFGDSERQARYLTKLRDVLKGDPMPKRGLNFTKDDLVTNTTVEKR